jgi:hypothetical protein
MRACRLAPRPLYGVRQRLYLEFLKGDVHGHACIEDEVVEAAEDADRLLDQESVGYDQHCGE